MVNVLVLCVGNSIRSQIAEAYFNFYAKGKGLFFSAGLQKSPIHPYAIKVMSEDNIDLSEHCSKSIKAFEGVHFNHLITVCDPEDKDFLQSLDYGAWHHQPVHDPSQSSYETEEEAMEAFRNTRDQIKRLVLRFIGQELSQVEEELSLI